MVSAVSPLVIPGIILGWKSATQQITAAKKSTTTNTSVASFLHQIPRSSPHISRKGNRTAPSGDIKGSLNAIFPRRGWGLHYAAAWRKIKCLLFDWAQVKMHPPSPLLPHDEAFFFFCDWGLRRASLPSSVFLSVFICLSRFGDLVCWIAAAQTISVRGARACVNYKAAILGCCCEI